MPSSSGFRRLKARKSRKSSTHDTESTPLPPTFQHPHDNLPEPELAALQADGWNLKNALFGPVWDHSLSNNFSTECLARFLPSDASRPQTPSPQPSMRSSLISPKTKRPVAASKQKENIKREDSHIGERCNVTGHGHKESLSNQETVQHTENRQPHSNDMPYSNDISYSSDVPHFNDISYRNDLTASQFEVAIADTDSEVADDEMSELNEAGDMSGSSKQPISRRFRVVHDQLRRYEFGGPTTAGRQQKCKSGGHESDWLVLADQMSEYRQRRESAPSPSPSAKRRRLNTWEACQIYQ